MKQIKSTLASLLIASAMISGTAFAEGATDAKVRAAAEGTVSKVEEAVSMVEKGADKEEILKVLSEVRQLQKEFRFEATERSRQNAGNTLKAAREEITNGDTKAAEASLKATLATYKDMLTVYNKSH